MTAVLEVKDLHKTYESGGAPVHALCAVRLTVHSGEFVAIMGASGSGKSTLLHLLGGLDDPTSGSISIEGRNLADMSDRERTLFRRRRLGFVFQAYNLLPTLTALENVLLPSMIEGRGAGDREGRGRELLAMVGLGHRLTHRPQAMSGGEQQRVAIARALMNDPALILADEPTGNLDTVHAEAVWRLLARLSREDDRTVLVVTHESTGATFADRVLFLRDGQVVGSLEPGGEGHASLVATRYAELAG
jgi:putative ABC transport system ATP-binding protein